MSKKVKTEKHIYSVDIVGQESSNDEGYMMTTEVEEGKEIDIDLPNLIKNDHNTDLDGDSNSEDRVKTKKSTCRMTTGH
eukprot:13051158-Ditylum_brightwellii.AAC.1